jgi:ketosteroid isomerase-like protein
VSGDIAVDRFSWTLDMAPRTGGTAIHDEGKCIWIWRREADGKWRHANAIWNSDLAQPDAGIGGGGCF